MTKKIEITKLPVEELTVEQLDAMQGGVFVIAAPQPGETAAARMSCQNNLKQISLG